MFTWLNTRSYIVIAVVVALLLYAMSLVPSIGASLNTLIFNFKLGAEASGLGGGITDLIYEPMRLVFEGNLAACIMAGVLWPLSLLWIILAFLMMIISVLGPGVGAARGTIGG
jgi:hypothetical protein